MHVTPSTRGVTAVAVPAGEAHDSQKTLTFPLPALPLYFFSCGPYRRFQIAIMDAAPGQQPQPRTKL